MTFWLGGLGCVDRATRLFDDLKIFDELLGVSEIKAMYRAGVGLVDRPTLVIPRRHAPIKIDGLIGDKEWSGAAETTGLIGIETGTTAPTPTNVRLLYDDEALYVAFVSQLPEKARIDPAMTAGMTGALRQTVDKFDAGVDTDDAVEVNVLPELPANAKNTGGTWYRLVVNGLNTHYDYSVSPTNQIALQWNPPWQSASVLDAAGWHVEIRIPFSSFAVRPPRPGDRWGLNFLRHWQALQTGHEAWHVAPNSVLGYRYAVAPVEFGGDDSVAVALKDWGPLGDNRLGLSATIANSGNRPFRGRWQLHSDSSEIQDSARFEVMAGATLSIGREGRIQDPATSLIGLEVFQDQAKQPLFRSQALVKFAERWRSRPRITRAAGVFKVFVDAGRLRGTPA